MLKTITLRKTVCFVTMCMFSMMIANSFAKPPHEYARELPVFGLTPKVAVFPLDFNDLIPTDEQAFIEPRLAEELRKEKYIPEKVSFAADDLAAYLGASDSTMPDNQDYRNLYGGLIKSLALKTDIVLVPSITVRIATMNGRVASGDEVTFNVPAELRPGERIRDDPFDQRRNNSAPTWTGNSTIYSLRLVAFSSEGDWLFTSYGGVAFPFYAVFSSGELKQKETLFTDKQDLTSLNKGISKAFYPLRKKIKRRRN